MSMSKIIKLQGTAPTYEIKSSTPGGSVGFQLGGDAVIDGNLTVQGTTTTIDSTTLEVTDNVIVVNKDETGAGVSLGTAGLEVDRGTLDNMSIVWDETADEWQVTDNAGTFYTIIHQGITGPGSGLDADTLDGIDSIEFAIKDDDETVSGEYTFDMGQGATAQADTFLNVNSTGTANVRMQSSGVTRTQISQSATDFAIQRFDNLGAFQESPFLVNVDSGAVTLNSVDSINIETPIVRAVADDELVIKSGSASAPDTDGQDLIIQGGDGNGTGNPGDVLVGVESATVSVMETPIDMIIRTVAGDISILPNSGNVIMGSLTYPTVDGNDGEMLVTDGAGNITLTSINDVFNDDPGAHGDIWKYDSGTANANHSSTLTAGWYKVEDFRNLHQDADPQLGGNLDVLGFTIGSSSGDITVTDNIKAVDDTALTIGAGNSATTGADLILEPGTGTTADGNVVIGTASSDTVIEAPSGNLIFDVQNGSDVIIGDSSTSAPHLTADEGVDLLVSGGDSVSPNTADGGDLILRGGGSDLGTPGRVILDGDVIFSGTTPPTGTPYPINFFIHDILTTGANANAVMSGHGVTEDVTLSVSGHVAQAYIAPGTTFSYIIRRLRGLTETDIGTIEFTSGNKIATSFSITDSALLTGDVLLIVNPATPDASIDNITITLSASAS